MNKYHHFREEDFVWDESFRQWVAAPTRETDAFWQTWLAQHPDKANTIRRARSLVQALRLREADLTDEQINYTVGRTLSRIRQTPPHRPTAPSAGPEPRLVPLYRQSWFRVAAMLVVVFAIGFGVWKNIPAPWLSRAGRSATPQRIDYTELVERKTLIETVNESGKPMPVKLSDGSLIVLKTGSRLSYASSFNGSTREVYLSGEGFFEVTKMPNKPFLIYANGLVTKVLGTSFTIKAYPADKHVLVEVKTGRVAVFAQSDPRINEKAGSRELEGVVLMPNQKIVYIRDEVRLEKSLVDAPQPTATPTRKPRFAFEDTPVPQVLDTLGKAYEIHFVYDEQLLANCPLTVTLTDQPLFEKLDIICRVIEARYELIDGQIVIHSRGCKP